MIYSNAQTLSPLQTHAEGMTVTQWKSQLASLLRNARGAESQTSLGGRSGVSNRTIGLIENERLDKPPSAETTARLAIATDEDPNEWLTILGHRVRPHQIEMWRRDIREDRLTLDRLKPAEVIEQEYREFVQQQLKEAKLRPAEEIKQEVIEELERLLTPYSPAKEILGHIDQRMDSYRNSVQDIEFRLNRLAARYEELANELDLLRANSRLTNNGPTDKESHQ